MKLFPPPKKRERRRGVLNIFSEADRHKERWLAPSTWSTEGKCIHWIICGHSMHVLSSFIWSFPCWDFVLQVAGVCSSCADSVESHPGVSGELVAWWLFWGFTYVGVEVRPGRIVKFCIRVSAGQLPANIRISGFFFSVLTSLWTYVVSKLQYK